MKDSEQVYEEIQYLCNRFPYGVYKGTEDERLVPVSMIEDGRTGRPAFQSKHIVIVRRNLKMENHFIDELLNQIADMQNFTPLSDELSAMISQYDAAEYELDERSLDFVIAAQGNLDYQDFLSLAEERTNNRSKR